MSDPKDVANKMRELDSEQTKILKSKKYVEEKSREPRYRVQLPQSNRTLREFAKDLTQAFVKSEILYYKPSEDCLVEIKEYEDKLSKKNVVGFRQVDAKRLLNIIESRVDTYEAQKDREINKTPTEQIIKLLSANSDFINCLHKIQRFLNYPMPFMNDKGKLIIPQTGYDDRYQTYFTPDTPELVELGVEESKKIIKDLLAEFCFKTELDRTIAISYLITPMCRGIYNRPTARTPIYIIFGNRERCGKDYLAGVTGIIYEGRAIDENPISDGGISNNEELRKKITSLLKSGRRRLHSSNNRGHLNNAVLEQFSTTEIWVDRELGKNNNLELNNEIDISLSANIGITYTPDIWHRSRPINLFYSEENPNSREFKNPDLHGYVRDNRSIILSAVYALIKSWVEAGCPSDSKPFTSFPEWSRVVGGIMVFHELGDPCITLEDEAVGGDWETQSMKELFSFMAEKELHDYKTGYLLSDIRTIIVEDRSDLRNGQQFDGFNGFDLTQKKDQTKLGIIIKRYVGREFTCKLKKGTFKVKLVIAENNERTARIKYGFEIGNVVTFGNISPPLLLQKDIEKYKEGKTIPNVTRLPDHQAQNFEEHIENDEKLHQKDNEKNTVSKIIQAQIDKWGEVMNLFKTQDELYIISLISENYCSESDIRVWMKEGRIFEVRPGFIKRL